MVSLDLLIVCNPNLCLPIQMQDSADNLISFLLLFFFFFFHFVKYSQHKIILYSLELKHVLLVDAVLFSVWVEYASLKSNKWPVDRRVVSQIKDMYDQRD